MIPKITLNDVKFWLQSVDRKVLIRNGMIAGALLAFILFFFLPLSLQAKKLKMEVKNLRQKMTQANMKIAKIPEMMKQKELFGAKIKKLRGQFFEPHDIDKLIEIISTAASDSGVNIQASRPSPAVLVLPAPFDKTYIPVSYELVIEGSYHAIGKLINVFESYPKSFAVHHLQMTEQTELPNTQPQGILTLTAFIKHPTST